MHPAEKECFVGGPSIFGTTQQIISAEGAVCFFANENTGVLNLRGLNVKFRDMKLCHMALSPSCFFQKKWYYI